MADPQGPLLWPSCLWLRSKQPGSQVVSDGSWGTAQAGWGPSLSGWQWAGNLPVTRVSEDLFFCVFLKPASWGIFPSAHTICLTPLIGPAPFRGVGGAAGNVCVQARGEDPSGDTCSCVTSDEPCTSLSLFCSRVGGCGDCL